MTCVVGLVQRGTVYIGVDAAAVSGWTRRETRVPKVFRRGPFLIGYTTSFRMGQLLEHQLVVPEQGPDEDDMAFMVNRFVEAVRPLLKEKGFAKVESNTEHGGQFLVGYRGHLFSVDSDFQVGEMADRFDAVGSGAEFALGAMKALDRLRPVPRIKRALQIASHFNMGVCGPFVVRSLRG
jgi:ATP-dependent protease HslVU (ClpYQ) peptidase subunit